LSIITYSKWCDLVGPEYLKINDRMSLELAVKRAAEVLQNSGIILYPTDTLYGFGIDVTKQNAVEKLYAIKGRSNKKPVSLMVSSVEQIENITNIHPQELKRVLTKVFPGKITALLENRLKKSLAVFEYLQYPLKKIGFRIPESSFCNLLNDLVENPVSTTSANISGQPNITKIENLPDSLKNQLDLIIDAGDAEDIRGSTIIDFSEKPYKIVREGAVCLEKLKSVLLNEELE